MNPNFMYLSWDKQTHSKRLNIKQDTRSTVQTTTSVGPYKNNFADIVLQRNNVYFWQIKIITGNHFKIGIIKKSQIQSIKDKKAFSDIIDGYAWYSNGQLRNGTVINGTAFEKGYGPGDTIKVKFDTKAGQLFFSKNNEQLKLAFTQKQFEKGGYVPVVATLIEGSTYCLTLPDLQD